MICGPDVRQCALYLSSNKILTKCQNRKADYVELRYYCVPSIYYLYSNSKLNFLKINSKIQIAKSADTFNICNTTEITNQKGMITSPGYPTYRATNSTCQIKISVPAGKSLNIWVTDINILKRNTQERFLFLFINKNFVTKELKYFIK